MAEENALKIMNANSANRGRKSTATESKSRKKSGVCHHCQQEGHFRRDCPKLAKDRQESKSSKVKTSAKANMIAEISDVLEMCLVSATVCEANQWYLDSGATSHMTSDGTLLSNMSQGKQPEISLADGTRIQSNGAGSGKLVSVTGNGVKMTVTLKDVFHVPSLSGNLLSVARFVTSGTKFCSNKEIARFCEEVMKFWLANVMEDCIG